MMGVNSIFKFQLALKINFKFAFPSMPAGRLSKIISVFQFKRYEILVGFHWLFRIVLIPNKFKLLATWVALQPSATIRKAMGRMRILKSLALHLRTLIEF